MDRRFIIPAVVIFCFTIIGFLAYNYLEIYKTNRYIAPSREVSSNIYLAMEMWLKETGHTIRNEVSYNSDRLAETDEKVVLIQSTAYNWRNTNGIEQWIENGGNLILWFDLSNNVINENLSNFLNGFGITAEYNQPVIIPLNRYQEDDEYFHDTTQNENETLLNEDYDYDAFPIFHSRISFKIQNEEKFFLIKDTNEIIRLAEIKIGGGTLTVLGMPLFMNNYSIRREANARLAWQLTGGRTDADNMGIVFVRERNRTPDYSVFASVFKRGNLMPVIISLLILIIAGFWMVIPAFGLLTKEKLNYSRPIKDRLTAEIQFLKKHHSLDYYLNIYNHDLKIEDENQKDIIYDYKQTVNNIKTAQEKIYGKRKILLIRGNGSG